MVQTVSQALIWATNRLREKGIDEPRLDAEVLLSYLLGMDRAKLYLNREAVLSDEQIGRFRNLVERRGLREPVAYLTGTKEFMSLDFKVNSSVLIPRPDTEILVEEILAIKPALMVDVGTGSGAIAISAAYYLPETRVFATDISPEALNLARENAINLGVSDRIEFVQGNLLTPFINRPNFRVDLIAANLPYIPGEVLKELPDEVRKYEPALALDGGCEGLDLYKSLIGQVPRVLKSGGRLLMEIGYDQSGLLADFLTQIPCFSGIRVIKDLSGRDRVVSVAMA